MTPSGCAELLSFVGATRAYASTSTVSVAEPTLTGGLMGAAEALACSTELSSRAPDALSYPGRGELEKPLAKVVAVRSFSLLRRASSKFVATVLLAGFKFSRLMLPFLSSLSRTIAPSAPLVDHEN